MPTPQASDKVANLDRILNLQKPIRYKFVNSIPFCYFSVNQVSTCYKQLYINLSSDEPYKIKSLWDAESMINHTTGDNEIYY